VLPAQYEQYLTALRTEQILAQPAHARELPLREAAPILGASPNGPESPR
jgi:hypothetical protein